MAGADDIVQNIVLAGQDEVVAGLNSIGQAGVQAFQGMATAASSFSIANIVQGFAGITGAIAGATAGMFAWVTASAKGVVQMANFANEAGTSTGSITEFLGALQIAGNRTDDLTVAFRRLAVATGAAWPEVQKSVRGAATLIKADALAVEQAQLNLVKSLGSGIAQAQLDIEKAAENSKKIRADSIKLARDERAQLISDDVAIAVATANVAVAEDRLRVARGGRHDKTVDVIAAEAALQAAQQAEADAQLKRQRDEEQFQQKREEFAIAERQARISEIAAQEQLTQAKLNQKLAQLQIDQAIHKQHEDEANSIENLKGFINDLAEGVDTSNHKVQLSTLNIVKGLVAAVGEEVNALKGFEGGLGAFTQSSPKLFNVLQKVADIFKNIKDETLRNALATELLGRAYSFTLVEALGKGSKGIADLMSQIRKDFDLTNERVHQLEENSRDFQRSLGGLELAVSLVGQQFALAFAPSFSAVMRQLTAYIKENREKFLEWGQTIRDTIYPIIVGLIRTLTGVDFAASFGLKPDQLLKANEWQQTFNRIKQNIIDFATTLKDLFTVAIPAAIGVVMVPLRFLSQLLERFAGIKISPEQLGLGLLVTQLLGINSLIVSTIGLVVGLGLIAASTLGSAGLGLVIRTLIVSFGALLAVGTAIQGVFTFQDIIAQWETVKQIFSDKGWIAGLAETWQLGFAAILSGGSVLLALAALIGWPATIVAAFFGLGALIGSNWEEISAAITKFVDDGLAKLEAFRQKIIEWATAVGNAIKNIFSGSGETASPADQASPAGIGGVPGLARGGLFTGKPGIDTNLAWLTHLEYVMNPAAVRHYGVWFMDMVNSMRLPRNMFSGGGVNRIATAITGVPKFATGGLNVGGLSLDMSALSTPALNSHAFVGSDSKSREKAANPTRSLTLVLGGQTFDGLSGPANVVDALEKHAAMSQMSSTGYKPGWRT